ncbi:MAG: hypothetical protein WCX73_02660 [Candidatus Pacearchaeota archaeon]|jgi:predicted amidophosphoribosyltransferase
MIPTCPKCSSPFEERDNFCMECGKNLKTIKIQNIKTKEDRNKIHKR